MNRTNNPSLSLSLNVSTAIAVARGGAALLLLLVLPLVVVLGGVTMWFDRSSTLIVNHSRLLLAVGRDRFKKNREQVLLHHSPRPGQARVG